MEVPEFRYMVWAKRHAAGAAYHLGRSGLGPPGEELLPLQPGSAATLDLAGVDMPEAARERLAIRSEVRREQVMLTLGTSHAVYLACATLIRPGDLVWVEQPVYEVLATLPRLFGARVVSIERRWDGGFRLPADLSARIAAERPRLLILSNPHNPTGTLLGVEDLEPISRALASVGGALLVDEVYLEFCDRARSLSMAGRGDNVLVAASFTKAYGLGAARFGWLIASPERVKAAIRMNDYIAVLYPAPSAWVGMGALDHIAGLRQRAAGLRQQNLPQVRRWVAERADIAWRPPHATTMCWLQLPSVADTEAFSARLLERFDTLVVPGEFFGAPGFVRVGFGVPPETLREGLSRLGQALDELR